MVIFYATMFIIPLIQYEKVEPGTIDQWEKGSDAKRFRIPVKRGKAYFFRAGIPSYNEIDPEIHLYTSIFRIRGVKSDRYSEWDERIDFRANKTGYYYIAIKYTGESPYSEWNYQIGYEESTPGYSLYETQPSGNPTNLLLFLLPFLILGSTLSFSLYIISEHNKKAIAKKKSTCPSCGALDNEDRQFCIHCGYTYREPVIMDDNSII